MARTLPLSAYLADPLDEAAALEAALDQSRGDQLAAAFERRIRAGWQPVAGVALRFFSWTTLGEYAEHDSAADARAAVQESAENAAADAEWHGVALAEEERSCWGVVLETVTVSNGKPEIRPVSRRDPRILGLFTLDQLRGEVAARIERDVELETTEDAQEERETGS